MDESDKKHVRAMDEHLHRLLDPGLVSRDSMQLYVKERYGSFDNFFTTNNSKLQFLSDLFLELPDIQDTLINDSRTEINKSGSLSEGLHLPEYTLTLDTADTECTGATAQPRTVYCQPDLDMIVTIDTSYIHPSNEAARSEELESHDNVLLMDDTECKPGFTKLRVPGAGAMQYLPKCPISVMKTLDSSDIQDDVLAQFLCICSAFIQGDESNAAFHVSFDRTGFVDLVIAFPCASWPDRATELFRRSRPSDWPSDWLLQQLSKCKMLLVYKTHPDTPENERLFEFRYSFSFPEQLLSQSLSDEARYAMLLTKLLCKVELRGTDFKTYHLKTTVFWTCLEHGMHIWSQCSATENVLRLLRALRDAFGAGRISNFFVPEANILDGYSAPSLTVIAQRLDAMLDLKATVERAKQVIKIHDHREKSEETLSNNEASVVRKKASEAITLLVESTKQPPSRQVALVRRTKAIIQRELRTTPGNLHLLTVLCLAHRLEGTMLEFLETWRPWLSKLDDSLKYDMDVAALFRNDSVEYECIEFIPESYCLLGTKLKLDVKQYEEIEFSCSRLLLFLIRDSMETCQVRSMRYTNTLRPTAEKVNNMDVFRWSFAIPKVFGDAILVAHAFLQWKMYTKALDHFLCLNRNPKYHASPYIAYLQSKVSDLPQTSGAAGLTDLALD